GKFSIDKLPASANTLEISYFGYETTNVAVGENILVSLPETQNRTLDEVVVTALGISREKKALGYAVSEIGGDEMVRSRGGVSNPINALQGKISGLQISSGSGSMGGSSKILIRGISSISGNNQPLFVVDGVPIEGKDYNSTDTQRGAGGYDYGNLIQDINPDDIENISVLKGPNAAALYGSRANNGVIMITTKKGKIDGSAGGYGVTFNSSVSFEVVNKLPQMQKLYGGGYGSQFEDVVINGQIYRYPDMATDESWGPAYDGQPFLSWYDLAKWEAGGKVGDPTTSLWQTPKNDIESFFETGVAFTNNVAISQATDHSQTRISYTNSDLKGYLPNSSLVKNIFNISASTTSADKKLEVFTNVNYFNSRAKGRSEIGYGDNNVLVKFVQWGHRELDMKESKDLYKMPDGTQATWNRNAWDDPTPAYSNNPYWSRYMNVQNDVRNRIYGNLGFSYKILPELKVQFKSNLDFFVDKQYERNAVYSQELSHYLEMSRQQYELNNELLLMFNKNLTDAFSLGVNIGGNAMKRHYEYVYGETVDGLTLPLFYNLKNSVNSPTAYNSLSRKAINSLFGNLTLGFKSTLYLDASLRNDWSSTLPKGNNSYLYPAVTGSLIFSELLKSQEWLSFGKLRLGYAMVGNDTDPYQVTDIYSYYSSIDGGSSTPSYIVSTRLYNPNLKPESTTSLEAGLEMNFFNDRAGFEVTLYSSETKDEIIPLSVSGSTGFSTRVINAGLITNKGVELGVHVTPIKTKNFSWTSNFTLASNKNKVVKLMDGVDYYRLVNAPFKVEIGAKVGEAYGVIMGTDYVYDDNGNRIVNEDGLYEYTDGNVSLGTVFPDFTGGWMNTFTYKNFDLSVLFDFSKGGHYFSTSYMWGMYSGMLEETAAINANGKNIRDAVSDGGGILLEGVNVTKDANGNITGSTPNSIYVDGQVYCEDFYTGPAAQSVLKSDYIKLREINIGYTVPLKRGFIKGLRISAYGRNLAVWGPDVKHFDPEMVVSNSGNIQGIEGGAIAGIANYGINLSVKF
ncbi:MAG: SusC/RagA family TonB-linked outer membrane protein, partial [Candidatus Symbiothrix sp.]|nr:SusC/RagA family TonB-linked outer membrane protein [Candidatus Symbiothrix sp.]